jgi:hypothetical protein
MQMIVVLRVGGWGGPTCSEVSTATWTVAHLATQFLRTIKGEDV